MLYYLYLDESGKPTRYRDGQGEVILENYRYFTLGGIAVNDDSLGEFHNAYSTIIATYFPGTDLGDNFKLHYNALRMLQEPYNQLSRKQTLELERDVFDAIFSIDCKLFSVTLDLDYHYSTYGEDAIFPMSLTLRYILERFQYFLEQIEDTGKAIYEMFTESLRDRVYKDWKKLDDFPNFPKPTNFSNLKKTVETGDPTRESMLAFADFFVYLPWNRKTSNAKWEKFLPKYYNHHAANFRSGNVEIE